MTPDTLKAILGYVAAIVTAIAGTLGVQHVTAAPQKAPQAQTASPLSTTVVCDTGALRPVLTTLEGQQGLILEELRQWVASERSRQKAEAAAWAAARSRTAANK